MHGMPRFVVALVGGACFVIGAGVALWMLFPPSPSPAPSLARPAITITTSTVPRLLTTQNEPPPLQQDQPVSAPPAQPPLPLATSSKAEMSGIGHDPSRSFRPNPQPLILPSHEMQNPRSPTPPPPPSAAPPAQAPTPAWPHINRQARAALVHIQCTRRATTTRGILLQSSSGSGMIIDPRGVVLTNAHIAYPLALAGPSYGTVRCLVRRGSPARPIGEASLLFLPPAWAEENRGIVQAQDQGDSYRSSGNHDYALLAVPPLSNEVPLPAAGWSLEVPQAGEPVLVAAYPVEFLASSIVTQALYPLSTVTVVGKRFSFSEAPHLPALFSLPGTILAQRGASGGGVFRADGTLVGIVAIGNVRASTTQNRTLYALSLRAIHRSLASAIGLTLQAFLAAPLDVRQQWFAQSVAPRIRAALLPQP